MITATLLGLIDENKLRDTLAYRSDSLDFSDSLRRIKSRGGRLSLSAILEECGLEKALWACRALVSDSLDSALRIMACDCVQVVLDNERKRFPHVEGDDFPSRALGLSRSYALGILSEQESEYFEGRISYSRWMDEYAARYSSPNGGLHSMGVAKAAVETMIPDSKIASYFSILDAHSRLTIPGFVHEDVQAKIEVVGNAFRDI